MDCHLRPNMEVFDALILRHTAIDVSGALCDANDIGALTKVRELLEVQPNITKWSRYKEFLVAACENENMDMVKLLLDQELI